MRDLAIGLVWHSAAATNLGVGALTVGNLTLARRAADRCGVRPRFTLIGTREPGPRYVSDPDIEHRTITGRYMIRGYLADIARQDIILDISAGDSFTDIYPDKRFAYMVATKLAVLAAGKPLILSPQTIGPFSRQPHTAIAASICRRATHVYARDALSMDALAKLAPNARATQVIDVAFAMPFTQAPRSESGIHVGLNISGLLMSGGYAGNNQYGLGYDYPELTERLIIALKARPDTRITLIPHVIAPDLPVDDDLAAARKLIARHPGLGLHVPNSPQDAKSFISGLDFLVGARMHATIAAFSAGVPVLPVSYSRKFEGLYDALGYTALVNAKGQSTDAALDTIMTGLDNRHELKAQIDGAKPIIDAGLERYTAGLAAAFAEAQT
ncbi:MAG: polysaccharide pyruvyl transferase family protein [Polymorphobacter sp.]|uniref:polysaccharide pyruvyl transferase family protein n=1 Tax=Polymorphobacter sp. TaxID=1909290 RepID=UPI003A86DA13